MSEQKVDSGTTSNFEQDAQGQRAGSPQDEAFEMMYRSNLVLVYRYATTRLGRHDGEDVVAEVFHAAAVVYRQNRGTTVTTAWLMSVTRNKVIDHWRRAARRATKEAVIRSRLTRLADLPADWHYDDRRPAVLDALNGCSTKHRAFLILHYVEGLSSSEIAQTLGATTSSVESMLARARRAFRNNYEPEEG